MVSYFILLLSVVKICRCWTEPPFTEAPQHCVNFKLRISNRNPLLSDTVSVVSSCTSDNETCRESRLYPDWDVISPDLQIITKRNVSYFVRNECIKFVNFIFGNEYVNRSFPSRERRVTLRFRKPTDQPDETLYVHTGKYDDLCKQDRDCEEMLQCYNGFCHCPDGYTYVSTIERCMPSVSTLYGSCVYSEQCSFPGSMCWRGMCGCKTQFWWDTNKESCVYEGRSLGETCELDRHCKLRDFHSICSFHTCRCNSGWEERNGICVRRSTSSASSRHQNWWLTNIAMTAVFLKIGIWKFGN